jgi:hypothetical protein
MRKEAKINDSDGSYLAQQLSSSEGNAPVIQQMDSCLATMTKLNTQEPEPVPHNELWPLFYQAAERKTLNRQKMSQVATLCKLSAAEQQKAIIEFGKWIEHCHQPGSPALDHVLMLVKFNVFRAMVSNGLDLGYPPGESMNDDDAQSLFAGVGTEQWLAHPVPAALQPTQLQRKMAHHPWIDILPDPRMRDNLLLAGDSYDDMEICADLVGFFSESKGRTGLVVWGEPWDIDGWEVTESFVEHWGWTNRGCKQLLKATNYWRGLRGDEPLQVGKILEEV